MKKYIIMASVAALAIGLSSCSNFLDEPPDNRTELNENNVGKILLSAYPTTAICEMGEMSSDNTDAIRIAFLLSTVCKKISISGQTLQNKIRTLPMHFGNLAIWQSLPATRF